MTSFELICDCAERHSRTLPDASVDLILTDPPYNIGRYSTGNIKNLPWHKDFNNDIAEWDTDVFDPAFWVNEFLRILKPTGNLFAFTTYNQLGDWHRAFDPVFDTFQFMVWHKTNPAPKVRKQGFLNSCELIICCWQKGHTWHFGKQSEMHNFIETGRCQGKERLDFPSQKPLRVLKHILLLASNEGDIVYDPFMGVGSTIEACLQMGRYAIGVEKDAETFQMAEKRLQSYVGRFTFGEQLYYSSLEEEVFA